MSIKALLETRKTTELEEMILNFICYISPFLRIMAFLMGCQYIYNFFRLVIFGGSIG